MFVEGKTSSPAFCRAGTDASLQSMPRSALCLLVVKCVRLLLGASEQHIPPRSPSPNNMWIGSLTLRGTDALGGVPISKDLATLAEIGGKRHILYAATEYHFNCSCICCVC